MGTVADLYTLDGNPVANSGDYGIGSVLDSSEYPTFRSFATLRSNYSAVEHVLRFLDFSRSSVAIAGPHGWGKSHLLAAVNENLQEQGVRTVVFQSGRDVRYRRVSDEDVLLVDDLQDAFTDFELSRCMRGLLDRRLRAGSRTMVFIGNAANVRGVRGALPHGRLWSIGMISKPNCEDRERLVQCVAESQRVKLSTPVRRLIALHLLGDGNTIYGAISRLKLAKRDWSEPATAIAACGILMPYMPGRGGWDVRDFCYEAVSRALGGISDRESSMEIAAYLMLEHVGLSESLVAAFFNCTISEAYRLSRHVHAKLAIPEYAELVAMAHSELETMFCEL